MKNVSREARKERARELTYELNALIKKYPGENLLLDTQRAYIVVDHSIWDYLGLLVASLAIGLGAIVVALKLSSIWEPLGLLIVTAGAFLCASMEMKALTGIVACLSLKKQGWYGISYTKANIEALEFALQRAQYAIEVYEERLKKVRPVEKEIKALKPVIVNELGGSVRIEKGSLKAFQVKIKVDGEEANFNLEAKDVLSQIAGFVEQVRQSHSSIHASKIALGGGLY